MFFYSAIIPVYNRPDEIDELLDSLTRQEYTHFEVLVVDDGSTPQKQCKDIVLAYANRLNVQYFYKPNGGQGYARNYGFERAKGDYFIVFDSDCLIPPHYFSALESFLQQTPLDAFGGPDKEHPSFTVMQKAISYSMTSLFTTGGIRGRKQHVGTFHPRSFNMGISKAVYQQLGGYVITHMGEDIEYSIRIINAGFKTGLIPNAYVYHKRRTNLRQFYWQLHFFGRARINVYRFYKNELKAVHLLPAAFVVALVAWALSWLLSPTLFVVGSALLALYLLLIALDGALRNKSLHIGLLGVAAAVVQLTAYGVGFLTEGRRYLGGLKAPCGKSK